MAGNVAKKANEKTSTTRDMLATHSNTSPSTHGTSEIDNVAVTLALSNSALRALSFLGPKKVVDSVLDVLELEHAVSINDVARRPAAFVLGIESMFGAGSIVITRIVCAEIARDLGVPRDGKTLPELVKLAHEKQNSEQNLQTHPNLN